MDSKPSKPERPRIRYRREDSLKDWKPGSCPKCGAPETGQGVFACGTVRKWRWYGLKGYVYHHDCIQARACGDACMMLVRDAINRKAKSLNWPLADVKHKGGASFGDWVVTVTNKTPRRNGRKK